MPQLKAAIAELNALGYDLPAYADADADAKARYDAVKGSAVNPVLREGNSDRRAPLAVKNYARKHPHSMGAWSADSKTEVATMGRDDFRSNEQSVIMPEADTLRIQLVDPPATSPCSRTTSRCSRARWWTPPSCAPPPWTRSSPTRSPAPRRWASCSRCTSRPR